MEAELKAEPTATTLAVMCSVTLQKGKKKTFKRNSNTPLSIIPSLLKKNPKKSEKQKEYIKCLSAH